MANTAVPLLPVSHGWILVGRRDYPVLLLRHRPGQQGHDSQVAVLAPLLGFHRALPQRNIRRNTLPF